MRIESAKHHVPDIPRPEPVEVNIPDPREPDPDPPETIEIPVGNLGNTGHAYVLADLHIHLHHGYELHTHPLKTLSSWMLQVVEAEGPVHIEEVIRRIREALGVARAGARIRKRFDRAVRDGVGRGEWLLSGDFLSLRGEAVIVRNRSKLPPESRKAHLISPEEYQLAIKEVVRLAMDITSDEIPRFAVDMLGINKATKPFVEQVQANLDCLVDEGTIISKEESYAWDDY